MPAAAPYGAAAQAYPTPAAYPTAAAAYPVAAPGSPLGYPAFAPTAAPVRAGNPLGRAAFVIALVTFGINFLSSVIRPFFYATGFGFDASSLLGVGIGVLSFFVYAAALALGITAARRAAPHLLAGIGIGIAGVGMIGIVFTWAATLFYRFL